MYLRSLLRGGRTMDHRGIVRRSGQVIDTRIVQEAGKGVASERQGRPPKSAMEGWSRASRLRLVKTVMACNWDQVAGWPVLITLTYAGMPMDGRQVKRHLKAFRRAWERKWGSVCGAWKLEFQRRGSVHLHLVLYVPCRDWWAERGRSTQWKLQPIGVRQTQWGEELIEVERPDVLWVPKRGPVMSLSVHGQTWVRETWQRITGAENRIVDWRPWKDQTQGVGWAWYFAGYSTKKSKEYQEEAPEGSSGWGRRWGIWGVQPVWEAVEVSAHAVYEVRRIHRGLQRARNRRRKVRGGGWAILSGQTIDQVWHQRRK